MKQFIKTKDGSIYKRVEDEGWGQLGGYPPDFLKKNAPDALKNMDIAIKERYKLEDLIEASLKRVNKISLNFYDWARAKGLDRNSQEIEALLKQISRLRSKYLHLQYEMEDMPWYALSSLIYHSKNPEEAIKISKQKSAELRGLLKKIETKHKNLLQEDKDIEKRVSAFMNKYKR